jgi:uncharacterized protein (UPF0264 family)
MPIGHRLQRRGHLLRLLSASQLESFIQDCRAHSSLRALAGSLSEAQLPFLESLGVDIVGIRSTAMSSSSRSRCSPLRHNQR